MRTNKFMDIHPKEFRFNSNIDIFQFRNALHYKNYMLKLEPASHKQSIKHGWEKARNKLAKSSYEHNEREFQNIKNNIRNVLQKRGLISENIYESYKYDIDGEVVDVSKVIEGNPECMLKPAVSYTNYFYELYISLSIPYRVSAEEIETGIYNVLATVQLLEQEHIYTKINLVIPAQDIAPNKNCMLIIPLFSHKDTKDVASMIQLVNVDALRVFYFLLAENEYQEKLNSSYGRIVKLDSCIACYDVVPEELASNIIDKVIIGGQR